MKHYSLIIILPLMLRAFCHAADSFPFYDIRSSFEENIQNPMSAFSVQDDCKKEAALPTYSLLGYPVTNRFGIAACAQSTSRGIKIAAYAGFNIFTYKTIRSKQSPSYPPPNICFVDCNRQLTTDDIHSVLYATDQPPRDPSTLAISNSIGNASPDPAWAFKDIALARSYLKPHQLLIVSVYGQGDSLPAIASDFLWLAQRAEIAGADVIELNLSCPNLNEPFKIYNDGWAVRTIVSNVARNLRSPLLVKVGLFDDEEQMRLIMRIIDGAGARGICGINSVPMHIRNEKTNEPFFGKNRTISGLSGNPIRTLTKEFIVRAKAIIDQEKLDLALFATGGAVTKQHLQEFLDLGADAALSATAFMHNPFFLLDQHAKL